MQGIALAGQGIDGLADTGELTGQQYDRMMLTVIALSPAGDAVSAFGMLTSLCIDTRASHNVTTLGRTHNYC